jgi:ubiquinone biosynthesis protein
MIVLGCAWRWLRERRRLRREARKTDATVDTSVCLGAVLRQACEKLGPAFVKLGQVLSARRDLLPDGIVTELARLQDGVTAMPLAEAVRVVETQYGHPLHQAFSSFSEQPLGSASLAQVHEARLAGSGEAVVVKVQRPGIQTLVDTDIDIIRRFVPLLERHVEELRHLNLHSVVEEFHKTIRMEMDFTREMHNALKFHKIFENDPTVKIPRVYRTYCTDKVLVMEKLEGVKIDHLDELIRLGYDRDRLSKNLVAMLAKQAFTHGLYNGDIHAGNMLVLPGAVIGLFDFGMVRSIDPETQRLLTDLFLSVVTKDALRMSRIMAAYAEPGHAVDVARLARDLHELLVFYYDLPAEDIRIETLLGTGMDLLATHKLVMPQELIMVCRAAVMTESMVRTLSPGMCFITEFAPFIKAAIKQRFSFASLFGEIGRLTAGGTRALQALPAALGTLLAGMNEGVVRIETRNRDLDRHVRQGSRIAACLALSMLSGALLVGSALLMTNAAAGWQRVGETGFAVAVFLSGAAVVKLLRRQA